MIQINCNCIKSHYIYNHSNFFAPETPTTNHTNSPSSSIYSELQNSIWQLFLKHSLRYGPATGKQLVQCSTGLDETA